MKMFYWDKRQLEWELLWRRVEAFEERHSQIIGKLNREDVVECDKCGCILMKTDKWKRPSTIELVDAPVYSGLAAAAGPYQGTSWATTTTIISYSSKPPKAEKMVEHYVCGRCWKGKK